MRREVQELENFVTREKVYSIYVAANSERVQEHGGRNGFPVNRVAEVKRVINPTTAE